LVWQDQYEKDPEGGWIWGNHPDATPEEMQQMKDLVREFKDVFAYSMSDLPGYKEPVSLGEFRGKPAFSPKKEYNPMELDIINKKCNELKEAGLIRQVPLTNKFASRPTIAAKRDAVTGEWTDHRFCINYVKLNKGTAADPYPLPLPEVLFRKLKNAKFFTKFDMRSGFHQLPLDEESQLRTAFWWNDELWCYTRMPYGNRNSSAIFQRVMDTVLTDNNASDAAKAFVDDCIAGSATVREHLADVRMVLLAFRAAGLKAHPDKSYFMAIGVEYLGHICSQWGSTQQQPALQAFRQLPKPKTKKQLLSYLGMMGFYRCYCPNYSIIAEPLRKFTKKSSPEQLQWDEEADLAYNTLVATLSLGATHGLMHEAAGLPFVLHTELGALKA
jgi:hypothetical protein